MTSPTALITCATSGIGTQIARQLAILGWTVLVGARDADRGRVVAAQIGGEVVPLDVTDAGGVAAAAAAVPDLDVPSDAALARRRIPRSSAAESLQHGSLRSSDLPGLSVRSSSLSVQPRRSQFRNVTGTTRPSRGVGPWALGS